MDDTIQSLHRVAEQSAAGEIKALIARIDELAEALEMGNQSLEAALVVLAQYKDGQIQLKAALLGAEEEKRRANRETDRMSMVLGYTYLAVSRLVSDPPDNDMSTLVEIMTNIEKVMEHAEGENAI